ncbi:MAG: peptidase and in, kexin, sedolisin [Acidimicrobiales bacterium]|nr:peptidase and in, kexin, sedolisin [Acidimicrobiales bacterium]
MAGAAPPAVDDPAYVAGLQWNLEVIKAPGAWRSTIGSGIVVAVVDSGIDQHHPDLEGQVVGQASCIGAGGDPHLCQGPAADDDGHGTHVAGLIAAKANDGVGMAGVAPGARLLAVRALSDACGDPRQCRPTGSTADIAAGIRWAATHGARIVNLSLGTATDIGPDIRAAVREAWRRGVISVLAAGNGRGPMNLSGLPIVVVTATDRTGLRSLYASPVGAVPWAFAAPGGAEGDTADTCRVGGAPLGIFSTYWRGTADGSGYACEAGTSMAAPQVSGGLALLLAMGFSPAGAIARLRVTARRPGAGGGDAELGAGTIDLSRAVAPPFPAGVRAQAAGLPLPRASGPPPQTGPLGVPPRRRDLPAWWFVVGGGLSAAAAADLAWRWSQRRRTQPG